MNVNGDTAPMIRAEAPAALACELQGGRRTRSSHEFFNALLPIGPYIVRGVSLLTKETA